jgi:single-strand DNA-binding protein
MQKLTLIGNVGNEAVIRTPKAGGEQFLAFTVACNESYKNAAGEKIEKTVWYDCVYRRTQLAAYIKKGDQIHVEGTPSYSLYTDREGKQGIAVSVSVSDIHLLNNKGD